MQDAWYRQTDVKSSCLLRVLSFLCVSAALLMLNATASAAPDTGDLEGRPIQTIEVVFEGSPPDPAAQAEFLSLLGVAPGADYSAVHIRDSLQALFDSGRVASARVEVSEVNSTNTGSGNKGGPLRVKFIIRRQIIVENIRIDIENVASTRLSEDELRAQLNMIKPGTRVSKQSLARNLDDIQVYLRERGYFNATVETKQQLDASGTRAFVTYTVTPGEQARVSAFDISITDFNSTTVSSTLTLKPGAPFTRQALDEDLNRIRQALIDQAFLAPLLDDPRVERDPEKNRISIKLEGKVGPKVNVAIPNYKISEKQQRELLPIKHEGNIDYSAIVEGGRRLRNKLQESGYFFAEVTQVCSVTPPIAGQADNATQAACENLNPDQLGGHTVDITYQVDRGRRYRLADIRIEGTNKLTFQDVAGELRSQKASALGFIPLLGYGRGYTSVPLLEQDRRTIKAHLQDFGYLDAKVDVVQGATINGQELIITFKVTEGPLTRVAGIEIRGNKVYPEARLRKELGTVVGGPYSKSQARIDVDRLLNLYARDGYVDVDVNFTTDDLPKKGGDDQVRIVYSINNEGDKVFINQIIVQGLTGDANTQRTKRDAIVRTTALAEGDLLRADRLTDAERALFATDAYRQVVIHTERAGATASGKKRDVIIDVEEKKVRVMDYGGGYSTDAGPLGLFEISNVNLMNKLREGAVRLRISQRQQLVRFEYTDPHFARYGARQFAPLALSVQYQRDSTVTRFFRSTIDRGAFGIVQRLDAKGNPIDVLGNRTNGPTINRFTVSVETQRELDRRTRSVFFLRYAYEDVRLFNLQSLLIKDILLPDRAIRLSRFGASFVRDTRERCELGIPRSAEQASAHPGEVCRFNQLDPTRGDFFTLDYSVASRQLGGNVSFQKFQTSYRRYYKVDALRRTVFAGNFSLGLATLFNPRDRNGNGVIDETDLTLPISERFFSGGSTTLRGFGFEEAGPRQVVIPQGPFRDRNRNIIFLNPFAVPIGGNALAVLNLEARIPLTKDLQVVPFYDGGNVFRRVGDIFGKRPPITTTNLIERINEENLRAHWSNTVGLGFRIQTPFGSALAIDYGFLLKQPEFLIPQSGSSGNLDGTPAVYRLHRGQLQFRFTQTF